MSLINDALQRAKHQPIQPADTASLQLRPAETAPPADHSARWLAIAFIGLLIIAGAVVPSIVRGRTSVAVEVTAAPSSRAVATPVNPASAPVAVAPAPAAAPASEAPPAAMPAIQPETTVAVPAMETRVVPPPMKLNGIVFHTTKPSAIVNGRTVFPNSRVGEFVVQAITPNSVQLVSATETNILHIDDL